MSKVCELSHIVTKARALNILSEISLKYVKWWFFQMQKHRKMKVSNNNFINFSLKKILNQKFRNAPDWIRYYVNKSRKRKENILFKG